MGPSLFGIWTTTSSACRVGLGGSQTKIQRPLCKNAVRDPNPGRQTFSKGSTHVSSLDMKSARALKRELRQGVQQLLKKLTAEEIAEECTFVDICLVVH